MRYIIIETQTDSSEVRAHNINRELYKISRPTWTEQDVTKYFLPMFQNGVDWCFGFEDTDFLPVNNNANVTTLKNLLSEDATEQEREMLGAYIESQKGGTILFKDIIPSTINKYTKEEMQSLGWFNETI